MKFLVLKKKNIFVFLVASMALVAVLLTLEILNKGIPVFSNEAGEAKQEVREIHMVTGEFKAQAGDKEIESYRWDPGTIYMEEGEKVNLIIYGVNGKEHPFYIEGTNIKGTVKQGEETIIPLQFKKEGVYRLICPAHSGKDHKGPMIAYIVVD